MRLLTYRMRSQKLDRAPDSMTDSLPPSVVQAETVDTFKNRLDKYWSKREVLYNYKAKFTGSGHRSYAIQINMFFIS